LQIVLLGKRSTGYPYSLRKQVTKEKTIVKLIIIVAEVVITQRRAKASITLNPKEQNS